MHGIPWSPCATSSAPLEPLFFGPLVDPRTVFGHMGMIQELAKHVNVNNLRRMSVEFNF